MAGGLFRYFFSIRCIVYSLQSGTLITQIWALSSAIMAPVGKAMIRLMEE